MPGWPENPRLIGKRTTRVDGLLKASGKAKYPSDVHPEGMLFGCMLYSPHAHAKITSIDTAAAEKLPGVKAVLKIKDAGATLRYQGDDIAAVAAETEEQARDAIRAIDVKYEVLPSAATEERAMAADAPQIARGAGVKNNQKLGRAQTDGDPDEAMKKADATIEATYSAPVITHVCLEPHGLTAAWDGDSKIVAWASTQAVQVVANELAGNFRNEGLRAGDVTVLTNYMGGGFGSKFGADLWGVTAAKLAKQAGKPVKMFLDRVQEHLAAGNRPSAAGKVKLGGTKDGKITALIAETWGTGGISGGAGVQLPYVYAVNDRRTSHTDVYVNAGNARAMRAPGHPQRCILMEAAVDDLADKLGIDPLEMRLANLGDRDMVPGNAGPVNRSDIYRQEIAIGAELIGWKSNRKSRGQNGKGPIKRGLGMALHQWGGGGTVDKQVSCTIHPDGSVVAKSAFQDIGTGARTIVSVITAEVLGLNVADITPDIGNSTYPNGQPSGGSTTTPSMAPAIFHAAEKARDALFEKVAKAYGAESNDLSLKDGKVWAKGEAVASWKEACKKLGMNAVSGTGSGDRAMTAVGVGGVQFADVSVDTETGVVKARKIVAVQDTGLIINLLTWESQVYGGVIGGLNYGLFEERVMDPTTGVMLNPDMELYKLAGASDIPEIVVRAYETDEMKARGVIGVGEPPTISTAAAIANAVTNAIGVRVTEWPMSPRNVLNALATASKEGKA